MSAKLEDLAGLIGSAGQPIFWAEDEIAAAQKRHPESSEEIWRSFPILLPTHTLMNTEFVYRAHVRELLDRVAKGEDTRPGTWAEIACTCHDVSLKVPLTGDAFGLYCRAWEIAFPQMPLFTDRDHYESIYASEIDRLEDDTRRKLAVADRRISAERQAS